MANNKIQYTIGLNVNANSAKATISSLQKSLASISSLSMKISVDDSDIKAASDAASQLQVHLQKALNQDTGKLDLTAFTSSVRNAGTSVGQLGQDLMRCGKDGAEAFTQLVTAIGQTQAPIKTTSKLISNLATTLKNTIKWQLSSNLIHGLQGAIQHAISYAEELNGSLNNIRIVTNKSADDMERFALQANKAAKELNTTTKKYTDASLIYYQQGDNDSTVAEKTALTIKAANVAFSASTKEMSEMLTAVWNSYKAGSGELEKYIDIMASLGATTATSTEEIATGMQKVASTANAVGVTMEQMSSIIATVSSVTRQSAESIGTAYKTILARMQDLKMGETLEDGVSLGKVSGQLEAIGIHVLDTTGNLRDMGTVIEELGDKWQTLSRAQQVSIAEVIAGKRQYTQLYALMENMDKYRTNLNTAENSEGTLEKQAQIFAESWEAASNQVRTNLESIYSQLLDDKGLVKITKAVADLVSGISTAIEAFGGLKGIILTVGATVMQVFSNKINASLTQMVKNAGEKLMSLTQSGREQLFERSQAETRKSMASITDSAYVTDSQRQRITMTQQVMSMEAELGRKSKELSQQQVTGIQAVIEAYKQEQEVVISAQKAKEQALEQEIKIRREIELAVMKRQADQDKSLTGDQYGSAIVNTSFYDTQIGGKGQVQQNVQRKEIQNTMQEAGMQPMAMGNIGETVDAYEKISQKQEAIKAALTEIDVLTAGWGEKAEHTDQEFSVLGEKIKTEINAAFGEGSTIATELNEKVDKMVEQHDFSKFGDISKQFLEADLNLDNLLNKIRTLLESTGKFDGKELDRLCGSIQKTAAATANLNKKNQDGSKRLKDFKTRVNETNRSFTSMAMKASAVAMSMLQLWNGAKNVVSTLGDSGKSALDKFFSVLTLLPPILTASSAATDIYTKIKAKSATAETADTGAKIANTAATEAQTGANYALQASMIAILAIVIALTAAFMIYQAFAQKAEKEEEERVKQNEKYAEATKKKVDSLKTEREEVEKTYDAWVQYDNERLKTNDATDEYVSATEAVLTALGKEEWSVYLTMKRYDELAEKIKAANKERISQSATQAEQNYKDTVNAATAGGNKITRKTAEGYGWANTTIDNVDTRGGKTTFVWAGAHLFADERKEAEKNLNTKIDEKRVIEIAKANGMQFANGSLWGFGDIQMQGTTADDYIKFANTWKKTREQIQEEFGWDIESTRTGQAMKDYMTRFVEPIIEARKEKGTAVGTSMLQSKYGDILSGEGGAEWYAQVGNQEQMVDYVKTYLESIGFEGTDAEQIAYEVVEEYVDSFGADFTAAIAKARLGNLGKENVTTYLNKYEIDYDAVIAYLRDVLKLSEEEIQEYLSYITNVHDLTGKTAEEVAKSIYTHGKIKKATNDFISEDLPQLLEDSKSLVGTDDIGNAEYLFKQYYGEQYETYWKKFLLMSEAAQKEALDQMSKNAPTATAERLAQQGQKAKELETTMAEHGKTIVTDVWNEVYGFIGDTEAGAVGASEWSKKHNITSKPGAEDVKYFLGDDGQFDLDRALELRGILTGSIAQLNSDIDSGTLDANAIKEHKKQIEILQAKIDALDTIAADYSEIQTAKTVKTLKSVKGKFTLDTEKDFDTIEGLVGKSSADYTTEDWALVSSVLNMDYEQMQAVRAKNTQQDWDNAIISTLDLRRKEAYKTQAEYDALKPDQQKAFEEKGGKIITQQEADMYDRKIQTMRFNANLESGNEIVKAAEEADKLAQTQIKDLQGIDVDKIPAEGTQAWKNMSEALQAAGVDIQHFTDTTTTSVDRIKELGNAQKILYQKRIDSLNSEIEELEKLKATALDQDRVEEAEDLTERIAEKTEERDQAILDKETVDEQTNTSVNTQLKKDYEDFNKEINETLSSLSQLQKTLGSIKLDALPKAGTQAYAALQKQIEGTYASMKDFYAASREEQIKFLGQAKQQVYLDQYAEYGKQLEEAKKSKALATGEADVEEWDKKIKDLEQKRAEAMDNASAAESTWRNELASYYQNVIKTIDAADKEASQKLAKQESRINTLSKNILVDNLSLADQVGQTGIENWATMSPEERAKLVMGQYTSTVNEELALRDKKLARYSNAKAGLYQTREESNGYTLQGQMKYSSSPVSKEAFTNMLSNTNLSAEVKGALEDAWDKAIGSLEPDEFAKLDWSKVSALLEQALEDAANDAEETCQDKIASIRDNMLSMYSSLSQRELKLAEEAVSVWEAAFKKIAALRKSILSGDDISDKLTNSLKDFTAYVDAYEGDAAQMMADYRAGTLKSTSFKLGTPEEIAEKEKTALGLDKIVWRNGNGIVAAHDRDAIGKQFGIEKTQDQFYDVVDDGKGGTKKVFNEQAYNTALHNAVDPYLTALLSGAGYDDTELNKIIADYWAGAPEAVTLITEAAKKMDKNADEYGKLIGESEEIAEAREKRDTKEAELEKEYTKQNDWYNITQDMQTGRSSSSIAQLTNDVDRQTYMAEVNKALEAAGFNKISSLDEMSNWDVTDRRWATISEHFSDGAVKARQEIYQAGVEFRELVTGKGYSEESAVGKEAAEHAEQERINLTTAENSYTSQNQNTLQNSLDLISTRQSAVSTAVSLTSASTVEERIAAAQALREAYVDADKVTKSWAETMAKAVETNGDLTEANKKLTTSNLRVGKSYNTMTQQQRLQYRQILKTNKVTVDGYKSLDEYFDALDHGADIYDEITAAANRFRDRGIDAVTEVLKEDTDEAKEGFQASAEDMTQMIQNLLPTEYDNVASTLLELSQTYSGDINKALCDGWDSTIQGFNAKTVELLTAMGLSADDIVSLQAEIRSRIEAGASIGDIDFLSVMANMDIDATAFDSMITALNNAMHQIEQMLADNGMTLDPPWHDIPTLASKGVGRNKGNATGTTNPQSKKKEKNEKAKQVQSYKKDEKERYHEITKQLEQQSKELSKLDKMKSRTFGANHLQEIQKEINALEKESDLYAQLSKEASVNLEANKKILESYGAEFNEDGTINYNEYMDKILADYNAAVDEYNKSDQGAGAKLKLQKAEEIYNEAKKAMEDYEEDMNKLNEAQENMLETQNKISAAMLEGIQYKVELKLDLNDRDIKMMQHLRDAWEDYLDKQDDSFRSMTEEAQKYTENLQTLETAMDELKTAYNNGTLNEADYASGMQDINDKMLEQLNNLLTIKKSIKEAYGNTLEKADQELEKHTAVLEHSRSVMQSYIQMQQLMGLGADYSGLSKMYQMSLDSSNASVAAAKQHLDTLKKSRADIEAQVEKYGWTDVLKQQWDDVNEHIRTGEDDLLSATQQALDDAQQMFANTMNSILQDFDETLFGQKNGLAKLEDDYAYYQEQQSRYLSTSKELYEVAKLNREIDQSIADVTTKASKERLKALKEEINAQAEAGRLTEYDVQMMELQYKHALALQELEDAKNAKSVVRLTRDENGNFGYQYTADDTQISDAAQKVDDALQQINELAANRVSEMEQAAVQAERQYRDSLMEIAQDTTLTLEERQAKMEELTRRHAETMQYNQEQYNNASKALLTNQQYVYERYGTSIMTNTGLMQDQMNSAVASMMSKTGEYADYLSEQMKPGGQIYEAMQKYKDDIKIVQATSGLGGWAGMTASVEEYKDMNEAANNAIQEIEQTLTSTLDNINSTSDAWNAQADVLDTLIEKYQLLAQAAADAVRKTAGNLDGESTSATDGSATTTPETKHADKYMYTWGADGFNGTWSGYDTEQAARDGAIADIRQKIYSTLQAGETDAETAQNKAKLTAIVNRAMDTIKVTPYKAYAMGGLVDFTGPAWVDGSQDKPELMLNSTDTKNLLTAVDFVRQVDINTLTELYRAIDAQTMGMLYSMGGLTAQTANGNNMTELQQTVTITADFPNATDRNEISAAFEDIINRAAQYANRIVR